jgi:hypothetical protein
MTALHTEFEQKLRMFLYANDSYLEIVCVNPTDAKDMHHDYNDIGTEKIRWLDCVLPGTIQVYWTDGKIRLYSLTYSPDDQMNRVEFEDEVILDAV